MSVKRVDIKSLLADPVLRAELLATMFDPGPDGTHIPRKGPMKPKIKVRAEDILLLLDECDQQMLWSQYSWEARERLLEAAVGLEEDIDPRSSGESINPIDHARSVLDAGDAAIAAFLLDVPVKMVERISGGALGTQSLPLKPDP